MRSAAYSHAKMAKVSRYKCTGIEIFSCRNEVQTSLFTWTWRKREVRYFEHKQPDFFNSFARTGWTEQTYGEKSWGHWPFWEFFFKKPLFPIAIHTKHACCLVNISTVKCQEIWTLSSWDCLNMVSTKNWDVYVQKSKWRSHLSIHVPQLSQTWAF